MEICLYLVLWPNLVLSKERKNAVWWWQVPKNRERNSPQEPAFGLLCHPPGFSWLSLYWLESSYLVPWWLSQYSCRDALCLGLKNVSCLAVGDTVLLVSLATVISSSEDDIQRLSSPSELELIQYFLVRGSQQNYPIDLCKKYLCNPGLVRFLL